MISAKMVDVIRGVHDKVGEDLVAFRVARFYEFVPDDFANPEFKMSLTFQFQGSSFVRLDRIPGGIPTSILVEDVVRKLEKLRAGE